MSEKFTDTYLQRLKFIFTLLFVYIVLFEFVLPVNRVLPRPSLLWESLIIVWQDYNLLYEISISTSVIYGSFIVAYLLIYSMRGVVIKLLVKLSAGLNSLRIFRFFPAFFYAVIFAYWFPGSIIAEIIFVLIAVLFYITASVKESLNSVNENHLLVAENLGLKENQIYSGIIWKQLQPAIFTSLRKMHYFAWILLLLFEYIGDYFGIGHVYNTALTYNDFAGLFSVAIYVAILILIGDSLVKLAKSRIIYWDR